MRHIKVPRQRLLYCFFLFCLWPFSRNQGKIQTSQVKRGQTVTSLLPMITITFGIHFSYNAFFSIQIYHFLTHMHGTLQMGLILLQLSAHSIVSFLNVFQLKTKHSDWQVTKMIDEDISKQSKYTTYIFHSSGIFEMYNVEVTTGGATIYI